MTFTPRGDLTGREAIVTGGNQGIFLALAQRLASDGAQVVLVGRRLGAAREAADGIVEQGGAALALATDVRSSADVDTSVEATAARYGAPHIAGHNAGA